MSTAPADTFTVAHALPALLTGYGVDTVFGIPGNHTVELYRYLAASGLRHVTSRHEQGAGFMADGYARATGRPGVCLLISGPGLLNAATAIAQAAADSVPMLVITAVAPRRQLGLRHGTLHELPEQGATAASFCRWSHTLLHPDNLSEVMHRAFVDFACSRPGPVHLEIPLDLMTTACAAVEPRPVPAPPAPNGAALAEAGRRLGAARQPLILVGGGAVAAAAAIQTLAERLDAPVLNTVNGKGICPYGHPQAVGGSPSLPSLGHALGAADCVLAVGTELAETDYDLLLTGQPELASNGTGLIRLDIDAAQLTRNRAAGLPLLGDARAGVDGLLDALGAGTGSTGHGARAAALRRQVAAELHYHAEMAQFFAALREVVPDAVLVGDSTRPTYYASWQYECPAPRRYFHSVTGFGTLGYAIPAAFGAALALRAASGAAPDSVPGSPPAGQRPVLALIGDGGVQFTSSELLTGAELGLGVPVLVWCNTGYEEITNSMTAAGVDASSTRIRSPELAALAAAHGCAHRRARDLSDLQVAVGAAVGADRPTLIEVHQPDFLTRPSGGWYR